MHCISHFENNKKVVVVSMNKKVSDVFCCLSHPKIKLNHAAVVGVFKPTGLVITDTVAGFYSGFPSLLIHRVWWWKKHPAL